MTKSEVRRGVDSLLPGGVLDGLLRSTPLRRVESRQSLDFVLLRKRLNIFPPLRLESLLDDGDGGHVMEQLLWKPSARDSPRSSPYFPLANIGCNCLVASSVAVLGRDWCLKVDRGGCKFMGSSWPILKGVTIFDFFRKDL